MTGWSTFNHEPRRYDRIRTKVANKDCTTSEEYFCGSKWIQALVIDLLCIPRIRTMAGLLHWTAAQEKCTKRQNICHSLKKAVIKRIFEEVQRTSVLANLIELASQGTFFFGGQASVRRKVSSKEFYQTCLKGGPHTKSDCTPSRVTHYLHFLNIRWPSKLEKLAH